MITRICKGCGAHVSGNTRRTFQAGWAWHEAGGCSDFFACGECGEKKDQREERIGSRPRMCEDCCLKLEAAS